MSEYRYSRFARKIYENNFGPIPVDNEGRSFEIHHIDGNSKNDDPLNLIALSIMDHYKVHLEQGDYRACVLIGKKMNISPEEISRLASLAAKKQVESGVHNFLGGKIQSASNKRRVKNGTHHWLGGNQQREVNRRKIEDGSHHFITNHPNKIIVECPHCKKTGGAMIMRRWHFDNCKSKEKPLISGSSSLRKYSIS